MALFGKKKTGWNCDQVNPDGSRTCRRVEQDKDNQVRAMGTEVTVGADPKTCDPIFSGDQQTFFDGDDEAISSIAKKVTSQCKKERGL